MSNRLPQFVLLLRCTETALQMLLFSQHLLPKTFETKRFQVVMISLNSECIMPG